MSVDPFLYPRTISVTRQAAIGAVGALPAYGGVRQDNDTVAAPTSVASGLPASIQYYSTAQPNESNLPGNAYGRGRYSIYIPIEGGGVKSLGFQRADIVTDDRGFRYQVHSPYWDSLGWHLIGDMVEV